MVPNLRLKCSNTGFFVLRWLVRENVTGDFGKFIKRRLTSAVCRGEGMDQILTREPSLWLRKKAQILNEEIFLNFWKLFCTCYIDAEHVLNINYYYYWLKTNSIDHKNKKKKEEELKSIGLQYIGNLYYLTQSLRGHFCISIVQ